MAYDQGLVARIADTLLVISERNIREKSMFGGWGFMTGKSTFVCAWGDGLLVKVRPDEFAACLREPGVHPFTPMEGRPMKNWVVVDGDVIADDPELQEWLQRGLRAVRS